MSNLDLIIDSVIDPTRTGLDPKVFDVHNGKYHLKSYHRSQLQQIIDEIPLPVQAWYIKGSILSRQWLDWSDVDIIIEIDPDADEDIVDSVWDEVEEKHKGERLAGTDHVIEIFLKRGRYDHERTEGLYEPETDGWVKGPYDMTIEISDYLEDFEEQAKGFDVEFGELKRDVVDYLLYQSLSSDEISALSDQVNKKIMEIDADVDAILRRRDQIKSARKTLFDRDLTPSEISTYGSKQKLPANVIQKMLERYRYLEVSKALRDVKQGKRGEQDEIDRPEEVDQIGDILDLS